ncbi:hypothetical protein [Hwanghaeella sp. LZ110]|uniref:hypothetical protein n=1 Tax=Hwanghaeella sp. LZ110 TaxID=3402810 RepID=UPI003B673D87
MKMSTDGKRIFIAGSAGSGKSVLARSLVADRPRVIIFDPKNEVHWQDGAERIHHMAQFKTFLGDMRDGAFRVYYQPETGREIERLSSLSTLLMKFQAGHNAGKIERPITLIVEEMAAAAPLSIPPKHTGFPQLIRMGRSYGISVVGIAQRPAEVSPTFRGNLNAAFAFRFSFKNDRQAIAYAMQDEAVEQAVQDLPEFHYLAFDGRSWSKCDPVPLT